jgi:hypothetical protein
MATAQAYVVISTIAFTPQLMSNRLRSRQPAEETVLVAMISGVFRHGC